MTRAEFLNEVVKIYFKYNCETAKQALDIAEKELMISKAQFLNWFGKNCPRG